MNRLSIAIATAALAALPAAAQETASAAAASPAPSVREKASPAPERLSQPSGVEAPAPAKEWTAGGDIVRAFVSSPRGGGADATAAQQAAYGSWFAVESPAPPAGYVLKSASFHLVGARTCAGTDESPYGAGTSAECRQELRDAHVARWAFRTQGSAAWEHSEPWNVAFSVAQAQLVASGPAGTSRGVLVCTYAKAPAPPDARAPKK